MKKPTHYIPRTLEKDVVHFLDVPEMMAIIGPRQCGKTTLLHHVCENLTSKKVRFVDFEDRDELRLFTEDIKAFAQLNVNGNDYVFIDEFQYAAEGAQNLKFLYDHFPTKIIITGSSATELSLKTIRYLVGRIFVFNLYPCTFQEVLHFEDSALESLLSQDAELGAEITQRINRYYADYLVYGGYPRVVISDTMKEKETVLKNIFNTYLLKEIKEILNYSEEFKLTKLIQALSLQIGSLVNHNELCSLTGFRYAELIDAINILEKTFVVARSTPFFTNKRLELAKAPKFFFVDPGFRNMAIKNFLPLTGRPDAGALHENFVATELIKHGYDLHFWRSKSKAEVDFIVENKEETIPVEVKTSINQQEVSRSFRSFIDKYSPARGFVASNQSLGTTKIKGTRVSFVPHWHVRL